MTYACLGVGLDRGWSRSRDCSDRLAADDAAANAEKLRGEFGPEYERTVSSADSRREAEADLAARKERRKQFDIRPLSGDERAREHRRVGGLAEAQFVDDPTGAVGPCWTP